MRVGYRCDCLAHYYNKPNLTLNICSLREAFKTSWKYNVFVIISEHIVTLNVYCDIEVITYLAHQNKIFGKTTFLASTMPPLQIKNKYFQFGSSASCGEYTTATTMWAYIIAAARGRSRKSVPKRKSANTSNDFPLT